MCYIVCVLTGCKCSPTSFMLFQVKLHDIVLIMINSVYIYNIMALIYPCSIMNARFKQNYNV